jgi:hypothetical protein
VAPPSDGLGDRLVADTEQTLFYLHDLLDVNAPKAVDGQALRYEASSGFWVVEDASRSKINTFFNGTFQETFDALVTSDGVDITMSLEQSGGGDLTMQFSDGYTTLDTTPAATITLNEGTDAVPVSNYVYILQSTGLLTKDPSGFPDAEHIKVAYFLVPSAGFVQSNGCYINQNWNDHLTGTTNQGHLAHIAEKVRRGGSSWFSGVAANGATASYFTISAGVTDWLSTSGVVYQMHAQTFPAVDTSASSLLLVKNWSGDSWHDVTNLFDITADSTGTTITNNRYFNLVFWGVQNKTGEFTTVVVNLPSGSYSTQSDAENDVDGFTDFSIPREFEIDSSVGFLIASTTFQMGATWAHIGTTDLRGKSPSNAAGAGVNDHGGLGGLGDVADHPGYLTLDGARSMTGTLDAAFGITTTTITATGLIDANAGIASAAGTDPAWGIENQNLVDKTALETISNIWTHTRQLFIDGGSDEEQLVVQGSGPQTSNLITLEQSAGTDVFTVDNDGFTTIGDGGAGDSIVEFYDNDTLAFVIGNDDSEDRLVIASGILDTTNDLMTFTSSLLRLLVDTNILMVEKAIVGVDNEIAFIS